MKEQAQLRTAVHFTKRQTHTLRETKMAQIGVMQADTKWQSGCWERCFDVNRVSKAV